MARISRIYINHLHFLTGENLRLMQEVDNIKKELEKRKEKKLGLKKALFTVECGRRRVYENE